MSTVAERDGDDRRDVATALVPARILNEHVYCPRLAWLEWEARAFRDNADTAEGTDAHRRVDGERGRLPEAREDDSNGEATSVTIASRELGVIAKLDKVERSDGVTIPVETKRGSPRRGRVPVWEPELAQLSAQVLLLREHGYEVPHAEVFFAETRTRKTVEIPEDASEWICRLVTEIRENVASPTPPPPLVESPKCDRCSLVGICLPDETNLLKRNAEAVRPRKLVAGDNPARPLYVDTPGAFIRKRGGRLVMELEGKEVASRRLLDISHLAVLGNVTVGAAAVRACMEGDIPILWFTSGGWFSGYTVPHGGSWVARRQAQYDIARDHEGSLAFATSFVAGKIKNQRTLLRRLVGEDAGDDLTRLKELTDQATTADSIESLLGLEGTAARIYFKLFPAMLSSRSDQFSFEGRNRRPPTDPVNTLLSFAYALLLRDMTVAALAAGLDPQVGYLHQPRFGRPSLALDLAEEFRPLIADSAVVMAINNGEIRDSHFVRRSGAVSLTKKGRATLIKAYERRVAVKVTHPLFGYKTSYRRAMELQARQLAAVIDGQIDAYQALTTR